MSKAETHSVVGVPCGPCTCALAGWRGRCISGEATWRTPEARPPRSSRCRPRRRAAPSRRRTPGPPRCCASSLCWSCSSICRRGTGQHRARQHRNQHHVSAASARVTVACAGLRGPPASIAKTPRGCNATHRTAPQRVDKRCGWRAGWPAGCKVAQYTHTLSHTHTVAGIPSHSGTSLKGAVFTVPALVVDVGVGLRARGWDTLLQPLDGVRRLKQGVVEISKPRKRGMFRRQCVCCVLQHCSRGPHATTTHLSLPPSLSLLLFLYLSLSCFSPLHLPSPHAHMHTCKHAHMQTCTHAHTHTPTRTHPHACTPGLQGLGCGAPCGEDLTWATEAANLGTYRLRTRMHHVSTTSAPRQYHDQHRVNTTSANASANTASAASEPRSGTPAQTAACERSNEGNEGKVRTLKERDDV